MLPLKFPLRYKEGQTILGRPAPVGQELPLSVIYNYFCQNSKLYQSNFKIPSHNGIDCSNGFLSPVFASHSGVVVEKYDAFNSSETKGYGVHILSDEFVLPQDFFICAGEKVCLLSVYWHAAKVLVDIGQRVDPDTPVILEGNTGSIIGRNNWTEQDKKEGRGSHLHFGLRILKETSPDPPYDESLRKYNGKTYKILFYDNGYKGYIDPLPFFQYQKLIFRTMKYVIDAKNNQYLIYEPLKIAFSIGDEIELKRLKESGLEGEPQRIGKLTGYIIYPLIEQERLRDIFNF